MLQNEDFIKNYELVNPFQITPKGLVNNRLYSTLEDEINKPFNTELILDNKVKVIQVNCVPDGGLLWESHIWDLTTGESVIDPSFIPPGRGITRMIEEDGTEYQINNYNEMKYNSGNFKLKYTEAICIVINDGKQIHEFFYHENPYNEKSRKELLNKINYIFHPELKPQDEVINSKKPAKDTIGFSNYLKKKDISLPHTL